MSNSDHRCCGSGVCIINEQGECWCGQVWNGSKMAPPTQKLMTNISESDKSSTSDETVVRPKQ
ncbi:hypothetical protein G6660_05265 [Polynucleobacter paneuropaeus]|nr:hypothetical protein [Polynucleobacter paneuropaeus]